MNPSVYIGIDLGGTSIKMGLVDQLGNILHTQESPTPVKAGYHQVLKVFSQMTQQLFKDSQYEWKDIVGVGVGVPAFLDQRQGIVIEAVNLGWDHVPLKEDLERMWTVPIIIDNDANAAALGEMWNGAGKGASHLICLTLGTGIGGGVIINGNIYHGANGSAGEVGHITTNHQNGRSCNCGRKGCLETEASGTAIVLDALEQVKGMSTGPLKEEYDRTGTITAKSVVQLARRGDPICKKIITKIGRILGCTLAQMCYLLNPEIIVIGGGVARAGKILFDPLIQAFHDAVLPRVAENTSIVPAMLGNQAGLTGAAWLIHRKYTLDILEGQRQ
ncbi:ROK family glucokinase [Desulfosporosinus fructosivorans]|uniref:Glucokinase n=1 Tax=Desulfosporosinus fructosivorans TaxID=2018669 RepID=A0A4Z0R8Q7_9FIRM|nr:ROK family glucokinase [Desulfosporosinus fructosivorans]TGE38016.1 ROK family glucokinase [Desulfosporosinus fructosivorans]